MDFPKVMLLAVVAAVVIGSFVFFTRTDYSDPAAVATAFTKALKANDPGKASKYYLPSEAEAWEAKATDEIYAMKSGQTERFFEGLPADPAFGEPTPAPDGSTVIQSADKAFSLGMTQVDGKWYVSKAPL